MLPGLFERIEIGNRRAALDDTRFLDHAGAMEQRLGERRLASAALPDKRNRADVSGGVIRHAASLQFVSSGQLYRPREGIRFDSGGEMDAA